MREPTIMKDPDTGEYKKGIVPISVVKGTRYTGDKSQLLTQNVPVIMSRDPKQIEQMEKIKHLDSVSVKGVLVTESVKKQAFCTECGQKNEKDGMIVYVAPVFIESVHPNSSVKEAIDDLYFHQEISNEVEVIGNLCTNVEKVDALVKTPIIQYQIAITRTYRINEDTTDYPWVKAFGDNAREAQKKLKVGSKVLIDGCLQARKLAMHATCDVCGGVFDWMDSAMEIVPYETEYLSTYVTDEDEDLANLT